MECPFCKIANKEIESVILFEDEYVMAVLDIFPSVPGQVIVFPKKHVKYIWDLNDSEIARIFTLVKIISKAIKNSLKVDGISIYIPQDLISGQRFDHLIIYIFPRIQNDSFVINWERKQADLGKLKEIKEKIEKEINKLLELKIEEKIEEKKENIDYSKWYLWYMRKP